MWYRDAFPLPRFTKTYQGTSKQWRKLQEWENNLSYQNIFLWLSALCLNMFAWEGLPDTCDERVLEQTLYFYGRALFFEDSSRGGMGKLPDHMNADKLLWHTPVNLGNGLNIYGIPTERWAYSWKYHSKFNITNSVIIRNTYQMTPMYWAVQHYIERIVETLRTLDIAAKKMKSPYLITATEDTRDQMAEMLSMVDSGQPAILHTGALLGDAGEKVKVWPTATSPGTLSDLWEHYHEIMDCFLTQVGYNNSNKSKRERVNVPETEANNEVIAASGDIYLESRQKACDEINTMFGTSISVKRREVPEMEAMGGDQLGGMDNQSGRPNAGRVSAV